MKKENELFSSESDFDSKNILNRSYITLDENILDEIDKGVTLEWLNDIKETKGIPIFKYKTQITIHGLFPEFDTIRTFGYHNIFQNKNKSIGIKYSAIDGEKRNEIAKRLKHLGFFYRTNSSDNYFGFVKDITNDNFEEIKDELYAIYKKINTKLFYGTKQIYIAKSFGVSYLVLELRVNAILEVNVDKFCNEIGATAEVIAKRVKEVKESRERIQREYEARRKEEAAFREKQKVDRKDELDELKKLPFHEKILKEGVYIKCVFDHHDKMMFTKTLIYLPNPRAKKFRFKIMRFDTIKEALETEIQKDSYGDSIQRYPIKNSYKLI